MAIELKNITHSFEGDSVLIDGLSLSLSKGERIALRGPNGAGKSTLMHIIMGLIRPTGGEIFAFGNPLKTEDDFALMRRRVGFLFQDSDDQLFCPTVAEDVAFGPLNLGLTHAEALLRVGETLSALGIGQLEQSITHRLSGGEKRLVAFATIAAMRPEVYILDEPTTGLDGAHRRRLMEYIDSNVSTCLVSSHDEDFLSQISTSTVTLGAHQN